MSSCSSSCGSTCSITDKPFVLAPSDISQSADALAGLLVDTPEFQALARWSRAVRTDSQVMELSTALRERSYIYNPSVDTIAETAALEEKIEALPVVRSFRAAEAAARALFAAVDEAISETVGLPFAELAKPSGHG